MQGGLHLTRQVLREYTFLVFAGDVVKMWTWDACLVRAAECTEIHSYPLGEKNVPQSPDHHDFRPAPDEQSPRVNSRALAPGRP